MGTGLWRWLLFVAALLLHAGIAASACAQPEFSHRMPYAASKWFTGRSKRGSRDLKSVNWAKISKILADASGKETDDRVLHSIDRVQGTRQGVSCALQAKIRTELVCFFDSDLRSGETMLAFPIKQCITSDVGDTYSGVPWEVVLASKLLRERSLGEKSKWAFYISSLPKYVPLPMLFSDMEMDNIEDQFVTHEILEMRRFTLSSFHALKGSEIAYAKFSDYVWALSVVYNLGCRLENGDLHFLFPFVGVTGTGSKQNARLTLDDGVLKLKTNRDVSKGEIVAFYRDSTRITDAFLFEGRMIENNDPGEARLFSDLQDLSDWFFLQYGGVNSNRVLTLKISRDATETLKSMANDSIVQPGSLTIKSNGDISTSLLCVVTSLFYAKKAIELHNNNEGGVAPVDFDNQKGTRWEETMRLIAENSLLRSPGLSTKVDNISSAFSFAVLAIQKRVAAVVASYSTGIIEDQILLRAASWEGIDAYAEEPCSSCRWQIDKQGWNDILSVSLQLSSKTALQRSLSRSSEVNVDRSAADSAAMLQNFSTWMENHGFEISAKLLMTTINDSYSHRDPVRGVLVTKDIEEGETLCTLPLDAGLYDESLESQDQKDSWDLAAVRLLQEKALGKNSHWADYIAILPRNMASPLYLDSTELEEVQWLPVLRELIQVRRAIKKSFARFQSSTFSYDEYKWAVTMVHSRAFTLPVLPDEKFSHYVLMPYMDMINHHYSYQADWMSQPVIDRKLEIIARRAVKKGEQLYASFGPRSNDNLFLYYGFVLDDNPFDTIQIFSSFEDAISWFFRAWTRVCNSCENDEACHRTCEWRSRKQTWPAVKQAIDDFESGTSGQSKDWWELVSHWSDIGYQFLPYQPGPNVYAFGISDPSLVSAFAAASTFLNLSRLEQVANVKNKSASLNKFFACIDDLEENPVYSPLLDTKHSCRSDLLQALKLEDGNSQQGLIARISIALRCAEILATLPTSISQDRELLASNNRHVQLAREFRYRKKLQLRAVIDRLVSSKNWKNSQDN